MLAFTHIEAQSVEDAVECLQKYDGKACLMAGGTDLLGCLKDRLWMEYPEAVVDLKKIPALKNIEEHDGGVRVGALATLTEVFESPLIVEAYPALAQAARKTASPLLRNMGTLGGNICQENRCWYYRYPDKLGGRVPCVRKGGTKCYAIPGDSRYHSIFGAVKKCVAVNPSDTAAALMALEAVIVTTTRTIPVTEFFSAEYGKQSTVLNVDEIVLAIDLPAKTRSAVANGEEKTYSSFRKLAFRQSIDFALVNCSVCLTMNGKTVESARICLNGVYNEPLRMSEAEAFLQGKSVSAALAEETGELALAKAKPLLANYFKVNMAKALVHDCLLDCFSMVL